MKSTRTRRAFGAVFALSLVAAACGSDDDDSSDSGTVAEGTEASAAETTAGSTDAGPPRTTTAAEATDDTTAEGTDDSTAPAGEGVRLGIMAECEGAFGGFNEDVVAGATLALINEAGATSNSPDTASTASPAPR